MDQRNLHLIIYAAYLSILAQLAVTWCPGNLSGNLFGNPPPPPPCHWIYISRSGNWILFSDTEWISMLFRY